MATRLALQTLFEKITGNENVYFQPPSTKEMHYPAIRYSHNGIENLSANNKVYKQSVSYEVIVIDEDPDSEIVKKVSQLPLCRFNRHYTADNLHHTVFTLFY